MLIFCRIDLYVKELDKLQCEEEYQSFLIKKNLEEYETGKELLRSLVNADLFRILEQHIEVNICHFLVGLKKLTQN